MKELTSMIEIDAAPPTVWGVLTDFASNGEWNPVEISMKGQAVEGTVLEHTSQLPGGKPMTFRPTIVTAKPNEELAWKGKIVVPWCRLAGAPCRGFLPSVGRQSWSWRSRSW